MDALRLTAVASNDSAGASSATPLTASKDFAAVDVMASKIVPEGPGLTGRLWESAVKSTRTSVSHRQLAVQPTSQPEYI
jgi:hypothetical protein